MASRFFGILLMYRPTSASTLVGHNIFVNYKSNLKEIRRARNQAYLEELGPRDSAEPS